MKKIAHLITVCFVLLGAKFAVAQDLDSGLVAKFLFDGNLADSSTYRNDLERYDPFPLFFGEDRHGNPDACMILPANSDNDNFLMTGFTMPEYNFTDSFSISFWLRIEGFLPVTGDVIYHGHPNGTVKNFNIEVNGGATISYNGNAFNDGYISDEFSHYVVTYNRGDVELYLNGEKDFYTFSGLTLPTMADNYLVIGKMSDNFSGPIVDPAYYDDIYVYNRVLTMDEILLLYGGGPVSSPEKDKTFFEVIQSNNRLKLKGDFENSQIFNLSGQLISTPGKKKQIDISNLKPGVYFLKVNDNSGEIHNHKFIKK